MRETQEKQQQEFFDAVTIFSDGYDLVSNGSHAREDAARAEIATLVTQQQELEEGTLHVQ